MKKLFIYFVIIILLILTAGISYLLSRPCDYKARFTANTTPDVVYFNILKWDNWNRKQIDAKIEITGRNPVKNIANKVLLKDTTLLFNWELKTMNDSMTEVSVCVSDPERKLHNRISVPFFESRFKKSVRNNLLDFMLRLDVMLKTFKYEIAGPAHFNKTACVCINQNSTVRGKAASMIATVSELNQFVRKYDLGLYGNPFLIIYNWDELNDSINFDFCFPIENVELVPENPRVKFKFVEGMHAVKTDFYGNYSFTDIAWYSLTDEAEKLGYRSNQKLIEVYHHDPHAGGNELEWLAEIYLGILVD